MTIFFKLRPYGSVLLVMATMIRMVLVLGMLAGGATILAPLLAQVSAQAAIRGR